MSCHPPRSATPIKGSSKETYVVEFSLAAYKTSRHLPRRRDPRQCLRQPQPKSPSKLRSPFLLRACSSLSCLLCSRTSSSLGTTSRNRVKILQTPVRTVSQTSSSRTARERRRTRISPSIRTLLHPLQARMVRITMPCVLSRRIPIGGAMSDTTQRRCARSSARRPPLGPPSGGEMHNPARPDASRSPPLQTTK